MKKPIKGYEGRYSVDDKGDVYNIISGKKLSKIKFKSGYIYVHLFDGKSKNGKCHRLHRIVAETFIPNPNRYEQVNHINGNKSDNSVSNLEWCSSYQNIAHSIRTGIRKCNGENNPSAKLTWEQVHDIREEYVFNSKTHGGKALAKKYGISNVMICKIARSENWVNSNQKLGFSEERSLNRSE